MSKAKEDYIKTTKEGRIYIKNSDFFKQTKVKTLIVKLKNSSIIKEIEDNKEKREELKLAH